MAEPEPDRPPHEVNPYAPPVAPIGEAPARPAGSDAEAEKVRRKYLSHEASVQSIGSLHYLAAIFTIFALVVIAVELPSFPGLGSVFLVYLAFTAGHIALGIGLNRLQVWARWAESALVGLTLVLVLAAAVLSSARSGTVSPSLLGFGIAVPIQAYILYLLLSNKGSVVFSPSYREVIARTPQIKYQTGCLVKFVLLLIVALILSGLVFWSFAPRR